MTEISFSVPAAKVVSTIPTMALLLASMMAVHTWVWLKLKLYVPEPGIVILPRLTLAEPAISELAASVTPSMVSLPQ